jgi:hypothetical protein
VGNVVQGVLSILGDLHNHLLTFLVGLKQIMGRERDVGRTRIIRDVNTHERLHATYREVRDARR